MVYSSNRLYSAIVSKTSVFIRKFGCVSCTNDYLFFESFNQIAYNSIVILQTSRNCYRLVHYSSFITGSRKSEYKSFRSISDMCVYLDSICPSAVENN